MRAGLRRIGRCVLTAAVLVLAIAGCGVDPADDGAGPTPQAGSSSAPTATATPPPEPAATPASAVEQQRDTYVPPELALMPPDEVVDQLVADAEKAYRAHWGAYDAAARTGFTDTELVDALLASAAEDTLESLHLQVAAIAETGRVVDGDNDVVGMAFYAVNPPQEDGPGLGVLFDVCVRTWGVLREEDGTAVRELVGADPAFVRARLVDHDGVWLLVNQVLQDGPCPDALTDSGAD